MLSPICANTKNPPGPCYEDAPAPPPPAPSGRRDGSKKPKKTLGSGAIAGIAFGAVVVVLLIVYCLCKKRWGGKTRESPRPTEDDSSQGTHYYHSYYSKKQDDHDHTVNDVHIYIYVLYRYWCRDGASLVVEELTVDAAW
jgi:hypothetical protein